MILWLLRIWYARHRALDLAFLWPECCTQASNIQHAKAIFATHAFKDRAWTVMSRHEIFEIIDKLEMPK